VFKEPQTFEHSANNDESVPVRVLVHSANDSFECVGYLSLAYAPSSSSSDHALIKSKPMSAFTKTLVRNQVKLHVLVLLKSRQSPSLCQHSVQQVHPVGCTVLTAGFVPRLSKHNVKDTIAGLFKVLVMGDIIANSTYAEMGDGFAHLQCFCVPELVRRNISNDVFETRDLGIDSVHSDHLSFNAEHCHGLSMIVECKRYFLRRELLRTLVP
jgi:hypothetical protein